MEQSFNAFFNFYAGQGINKGKKCYILIDLKYLDSQRFSELGSLYDGICDEIRKGKKIAFSGTISPYKNKVACPFNDLEDLDEKLTREGIIIENSKHIENNLVELSCALYADPYLPLSKNELAILEHLLEDDEDMAKYNTPLDNPFRYRPCMN